MWNVKINVLEIVRARAPYRNAVALVGNRGNCGFRKVVFGGLRHRIEPGVNGQGRAVSARHSLQRRPRQLPNRSIISQLEVGISQGLANLRRALPGTRVSLSASVILSPRRRNK